MFLSRIFGHVRGVEANFEKIKNVINSSKNKVDDLKLGVEILLYQSDEISTIKNFNFRYTS